MTYLCYSLISSTENYASDNFKYMESLKRRDSFTKVMRNTTGLLHTEHNHHTKNYTDFTCFIELSTKNILYLRLQNLRRAQQYFP